MDHLECEYIPGTKSGGDDAGIKVKGTIHFVAINNSFKITVRQFKNLTKPEYLWPAEEIAKGTPIEELLTPNSLTESFAYAENFLKTAKVEDKFQFIRKGYYCMDRESTPDNYIFNNTINLKDGFKK